MEKYRKIVDGKDSKTKWKNERRNIFMVLCYEALLFGIELTIFEPSEYFYFRRFSNTQAALLCYSLSLACSVLTALISSFIVSYLIRRHELYSGTSLMLMLVSILGYVIYCTAKAPYLVILGKSFAGFGKSTNIVSSVYLQRLYSNEELELKMIVLTNFVTIGSILGPFFTYIFVLIDTNLHVLYLSYENAPGFYLAIFKLILFILAFFLLNDIPGENDQEHFIHSKKRFTQLFCHSSETRDKDESACQGLFAQCTFTESEDSGRELNETLEPTRSRNVVSITTAAQEMLTIDTSLILLVVISYGMVFKIINTLIPVESSLRLEWGAKRVAAISIANCLVGTIASMFLTWCIEKTSHYIAMFTGMLACVMSLSLFSSLPSFNQQETPFTVIFCSMSILNVLMSCFIGLSSRLVLMQCVEKKFRQFSDAFRACLLEISYLIGALLTAAVHMNLTVSGTTLAVFNFILFVTVIVKFKKLWI